MPLKDRKNPRRLKRLGIIRLGYKETKTKTRQDGSTYTVTYPKQSDHFLLHDAPEIAEFYHGDVRELDVIFPFPDVWRNFDAAYTVWAGGVLVCKGDGEYVQYAGAFKTEEKNEKMRVYNAPGDTVVSDGVAQTSFKWNGQKFEKGELVPCPGVAADYYPHCRACKMSAILKIMMGHPELFRLGYYQIATGSGRNYDTILGTLELIHEQAGKVSGIPFKLNLVEEATTYKDDSGQRRSGKKWFLQLEPDPTFTRRLYASRANALIVDVPKITATAQEPQDQGWEIIEEEAPPPFAENGEPAVEKSLPPDLASYLERYAELWAEAQALKIEVDKLPDNPTIEQVETAGKALKAIIDKKTAELATGKPTKRTWPASIIDALIREKSAKDSYQAVGMLNKSKILTPEHGEKTAVDWGVLYRAESDGGKEPQEAADTADGWLADELAASE